MRAGIPEGDDRDGAPDDQEDQSSIFRRRRREFALGGSALLIAGLVVPAIPDLNGEGLSWTIALMGGIGGTVTVLCYGYWITEKGVLEIDDHQAGIIRRIYKAYAEGVSPRAMAHQLNAEGEPGPRGGEWTPSTINGVTWELISGLAPKLAALQRHLISRSATLSRSI